MLATQVKELLHRLRSGTLESADAALFDQIPFSEFIPEIRTLYPVLFQERAVGRKLEVGMACSVQLEIAAHRLPKSLVPAAYLLPVLRRCLFVSSYGDSITEITATSSLHVRPVWGADNEVQLRMSRGFKLDRTPDGWAIRPLQRRAVTLSEDFLLRRGWKFDALLPVGLKRTTTSRAPQA